MTRKEAIERIKSILEECIEDEYAVSYVTSYDADALDMAIKALKQEPCEDCISRQAAIDALNGIINRFEQILRDIRESKVDDSVCGMCEYDGAYIGQSGDWCNECPGFEKDDCFRLSDECRKRWLESVELPAAQPGIIRCKDCKYARLTTDGSCKYCDIWFPDEAEYVDGDYYCASAERKSNG